MNFRIAYAFAPGFAAFHAVIGAFAGLTTWLVARYNQSLRGGEAEPGIQGSVK